jgi:hypothetical protein
MKRNAGWQNSRRLTAILIAFVVLILPHVLISLPGVRKSDSRPLILGLFFVSFSSAICWCGIDPRSRMLRNIASYDDPKYDSVRPTIVRKLRLFCIGMGVFVFWSLALPWVAASIRMVKGEKPVEVVGVVETARGAWYFQSVTLSSAGGQYELFYSLAPLRVGETYGLEVFPNSNLVLDFRQLS